MMLITFVGVMMKMVWNPNTLFQVFREPTNYKPNIIHSFIHSEEEESIVFDRVLSIFSTRRHANPMNIFLLFTVAAATAAASATRIRLTSMLNSYRPSLALHHYHSCELHYQTRIHCERVYLFCVYQKPQKPYP